MNPALPDALAHCLATEGKSRPIVVAGLGIFHLRKRENDWYTLFLLAPEIRAALAGEENETADALAADHSDRGLSFADWLGKQSGFGPDWAVKEIAGFVAPIRDAVVAGKTFDLPALGTFSLKVTTPKTITDPHANETMRVGPRKAICFDLSEALRKRLARA